MVNKKIIVRSTALRRGGYLREYTSSRSNVRFLVYNATAVQVSEPPLRYYAPSRGRSEEVLEVVNQIKDQLDLANKYCPCRYYAKMHDCGHLQYALQLA
ncbi:hypothetical protein GN244_ATG13156 [Phytophthora infestans]|uniref:SWIM-type domain-containing protein n=1 Tax=Phytophthora infestans TaxID=4787 RepID=A0A833SLI1_PHYIN|nr:hypothetical protein GN244_ATG13156 [Phytophthora infestans]